MFFKRNEISKRLNIIDPFLMIDEINIDLNLKKAVSLKKLSKEDWFYSCHMPHSPVMPATLQMEGMLQTLVILIYSISKKNVSIAYVVDAKTKFHSRVFNQSFINYHAELFYNRRGIFRGEVIGKYGEEKICEGEFTYASPNLMNVPSSRN